MPNVLGFIAHIFLYVDLTARGPLSSMWQVLAVLAVAGIVLVVVLAIIEPGPLVKRRPFPREKRSRRSESDGAPRTSLDPHTMPAGVDGNLDQKEGP